jgi:hypothetical protein
MGWFGKAESVVPNSAEQIPARATENQRKSGGAVPHIGAEPVNMRDEIAKLANVSHDTIARQR